LRWQWRRNGTRYTGWRRRGGNRKWWKRVGCQKQKFLLDIEKKKLKLRMSSACNDWRFEIIKWTCRYDCQRNKQKELLASRQLKCALTTKWKINS
jgi:hypothetical protein